MKKLLWFTETNINHTINSGAGISFKDKTTDLTKYIKTFTELKLWEKENYRNEYTESFEEKNLNQLKSIKIHLHSQGYPFSSWHSYEKLVESYIEKGQIEKEKLLSSGISEASKIAVVEVDYESDLDSIKNLTYEEEKDSEKIYELLTKENHSIWREQNMIKNITCEFIQFFTFNLHLNFLTRDYGFNFIQKAKPVGFIAVISEQAVYYETDTTDLLAHYILWEEGYEVLTQHMDITSEFWCKYISSIHLFLDALKGNHITSSNFIKLVFTLESFFSRSSSNDFMTLVSPLLISSNIKEMKNYREIIKKSFNYRNDIVHGGKVHNIKKNDEMIKLFFELKNIISRIFAYLINNKLYLKNSNPKLNHELIFNLFPKGING
jgi:hypothetical protein